MVHPYLRRREGREPVTYPDAATRRVLNVPDDEYIVCGVSLGYEDKTSPVNTLVSEREPLENFATFHGF